MRLLYGVQANGNGHITRARTLLPALRRAGHEVTCIFSGRPRQALFDMEAFGAFLHCPGVNLATRNGRVRILATLRGGHARRLLRDIRELDVGGYDAVITDFEPISARAGRRRGLPVVGIGHQYAFRYSVPKPGDLVARAVLRHLAPVDVALGLHWDHFGQLLLPPIIDHQLAPTGSGSDTLLVYLTGLPRDEIIAVLGRFPDRQFRVYLPTERIEAAGNVTLLPLNRTGFLDDLQGCGGVITHAGFELPSEVLHLGKPLLAIPLRGHGEQRANGKALELLDLGCTGRRLSYGLVQHWLREGDSRRVQFPDVAGAIAAHLEPTLAGDLAWTADLWAQVKKS